MGSGGFLPKGAGKAKKPAAPTDRPRYPKPDAVLVPEGTSEAIAACLKAMQAAALAYPETFEDFPWEHRVVKVRGKIFLFLDGGPNGLRVNLKLPHSAEGLLALPFASPTPYGLGRSGWVTLAFAGDEAPPTALLLKGLEESYRAVAPKKLVAAWEAGPQA